MNVFFWPTWWCAGRDLNPHGISTTSPSNSRVCHSTTRAHRTDQPEGLPELDRDTIWPALALPG
jgi:hypothetical protein